MVYYHTSGNVKMIRNILIDYNAVEEISPYEYMKTYIEKCPETTEDAKISWIAETFLGIQKHNQFLKTITNHMSEQLTDEDQDYFLIIFHAVTFQIQPKDMPLLYKCLFNLSKPMLNTFTDFLSNNEVLTFISEVALATYDTSFITDKIVGPLFNWQPYISEMAHSYAEYVKKIESRKIKRPTVPIHQNTLDRKSKKECPVFSPSGSQSLPISPPDNKKGKQKKMLTKSTIDQRIKAKHEKNKLRAEMMLKDVKNNNLHVAQDKSEKYYKALSNPREGAEIEFESPLQKPKQKYVLKQAPPIKETTATVKRLNKTIQIAEKGEIMWLEELVNNCKNTYKIGEIEEFDRQQRERERLYDIERKHLVGQISHEEALLAKKKIIQENKKNYKEFLKEKETWYAEIENWKKEQIEKNRKQIEKLSMTELNILQAKHELSDKKKEIVDQLKKESRKLTAQAMEAHQEELERRINMIKEIKILSLIAKKARVPKVIDLTETAGLGLLCEMSVAELQERLNLMKMGLKEALELKKKQVKEKNMAAKQELEDNKNTIKNYCIERAAMKKQSNKKSSISLGSSASKEINNLKKILEEKRKLRRELSN